MLLQYKVTLLVLKLLSETYFQCSFCDKLQLEEKFFIYFKTGSVRPDDSINVTKIQRFQGFNKPDAKKYRIYLSP